MVLKGIKIISPCILLLLLNWPVYPQTGITDTVRSSSYPGQSLQRRFIPKKFDIGVQAGTWFSTGSGYGSGWSTYLSPRLSYNLSSRFRISGGISLTNTYYTGVRPLYYPGSGNAYHGDVTSAFLYVSGQYLVSDRFSVTGSAFKKFNIYESSADQLPWLKDEPYGFYLNLDYRIRDNIHLQGGIGYTRGAIDPYYGSPLYSPVPPFYNPYFPQH